ncbi:hypothetical protein G6F37_011885 [Rhizopus arrhizus]|nr:hypothetical protein G6F38_011953 [Rhizopus arrhizus]KAG1146837.1 hypothetical protein G6F37_011885 [Rhizopus arrhizus]
MSNFLNKSNFYLDFNFTINSKRKRPPSPDLLEGPISSAEVKRTLLVKDINITEAFKRFRKQSNGRIDEGDDINCLRILSLSHIFPLNKFDGQKCVTRYFYGSTRKALRSIASRMRPRFDRTPNKAVVYCKNEADRAGEDDEESEEEEKEEREERKEREEEENEAKKDMMSMVKYLFRHEIQFRACVANTSEASFIEKHLMPATQKVLLQDASKDLLYAM